MPSLPPLSLNSDVAAADRTSAIDFVNRVNWLFEAWDVDAMVEAFLPDSVTYHFHGTNRGQAETRRFFDEVYPYLVPGVSRHATNHVVDRDGDGVIVRYHNLLVRYAHVEQVPAFRDVGVLDSVDGLPAICIYSAMIDRLRMTPAGWRILERHVGVSTTDHRLSPAQRDPAYFVPYLPVRDSR